MNWETLIDRDELSYEDIWEQREIDADRSIYEDRKTKLWTKRGRYR